MKTNFIKYLAGLLISLFFITPSHAALVEIDDPVFGEGAITQDTVAALEWLDIGFSYGLSRNYVNTQFGPGGQFEGFRYATTEEAEGLLQAAGITLGEVQDEANFAAVAYLATLVGKSGSAGGYPEIGAQTGSGTIVGADFYYANGIPTYRTGSFGGCGPSATWVSSWLVREATPVPIPGAVWLLGSGLVVLLGSRRKKGIWN